MAFTRFRLEALAYRSVLEANNELWLELIINQQTLSPRQKINSVPYALVAKSAESIAMAPGSKCGCGIASLQAFDVARPSQAPVLLSHNYGIILV